MADLASEINAALASDNPIPREKVLLWIDAAADLPTLAKLYRLTDEAYYRIQPDLGKEVTCALIQRYLLECIRQDVAGDDKIESRFDAAQSLHLWFCHLLEMEDMSTILTGAACAVTELFLAGGENVRYSIETGFLEHVLETPALRPYFEHWSSDPRLKDAWERAIEWGNAHPDFTRKLFGRLRDREDK
jgi:hypothetical protein